MSTQEQNPESFHKKSGSLTEIWAVSIIGLCVVVLILGVFAFVLNKTIYKPKVISLDICVVSDSISTGPSYSTKEIDSLLIVTKHTLDSYDHHFKTEKIQQEQDDNYKAFASLLLSVALGLGGFFGFKSFKDIKDKGEKMAEDISTDIAKAVSAKVANEVANGVAKKTSEDYLAHQLPGVVQKQFDESISETTINSIKESVKGDLTSLILQEIEKRVFKEEKKEEDEKVEEEENKEESKDGSEPSPMSPEEMFNPGN